MALSRRKFIAFAGVTAVAAAVIVISALFGADLYLHKRAERSAGLNVWGYRGPLVGKKRPGEVRIAVLGGSTAFGYGLPWFEAAPAVLERKLNERRGGRPPIAVVNLGFNNEGAYSYRFTLHDFAFLDYDVACLYDGYNDMRGDVAPNTALYRHDSAVFRLTGYFPILPLVLEEKAMQIRSGGNLNAAYAARRGEAPGKTVFVPTLAERASAATLDTAANITQALGRQLGRVSVEPAPRLPDTADGGCESPWKHYCESMYGAVKYARDRGKQVYVVLQPRMIEPVTEHHRSQQAALIGMLQRRFGGDSSVHVIDLSSAVDLHDRDYAFDNLHLSTDGTEIATSVLAERMAPLLSH